MSLEIYQEEILNSETQIKTNKIDNPADNIKCVQYKIKASPFYENSFSSTAPSVPLYNSASEIKFATVSYNPLTDRFCCCARLEYGMFLIGLIQIFSRHDYENSMGILLLIAYLMDDKKIFGCWLLIMPVIFIINLLYFSKESLSNMKIIIDHKMENNLVLNQLTGGTHIILMIYFYMIVYKHYQKYSNT